MVWPAQELAENTLARTRLGRYECIRRIAVGGMAELYLGRMVGPGGFEKLVAIKRVLPQRTEETDFVRMFVQEARTAATLDHANIVKVLDFGVADADHYLVMEYLHGRDLLDIRRALPAGPWPLDVAIAIAIAVAQGLHYVHERTDADGRAMGLVHRDISPSNVFVCFSGEVKIVDFGIAKATAMTMGTRSGALKGKIAYMSPEQCAGGAIDRRSDIHALGNLLYGWTTGRRMYAAANEFGLFNRVASGQFEPPSVVWEGYPPELEAIVMRAAAVDPSDRFGHAKLLADELERFALDRGLRVGTSVVAEFMERVFGSVPYPSIPAETSSVAITTAEPSDGASTSGRPRRTRTRFAILGALVVGAALGVWLRPEPTPASNEPLPTASTITPPTNEPVPRLVTANEDPVETVVPSKITPPVDAPIASSATTAKPKPVPGREPKRARSKRRPTSEPAARPAHADIFLPPSKRPTD